ncbi:hypothetical protein IB286_07590 [Spongiibacter sp. KMU-158]|uniref:Uncharacterized protein n=1 Tax=Spongiibacter pelagi TaxID=2760804 RepID=A0A927GW86_9GAMM|nr:hypothetical protein [Spongiibacter pelagi]MBD2858873.1 hypothetical protein [Spongiibacter pelagi]
MGYKDVKAQVLACLKDGAVSHQERADIDVKNLLATGQVSLDDVATIIGRSRGSQYSSSPHHVVDDVEVHIIKTKYGDEDWYIKWYFIEPNSVFISVHH